MTSSFSMFDPGRVPSPCYVVDEAVVEANLQILARVQDLSGARVLLALKAFSMFRLAKTIMGHLPGVAASGLWEARLGREEFGGEVHVYSPAYSPDDLDEALPLADHVVFNSLSQWSAHKDRAQAARPDLRFGLRINPRHSEGANPLYDPCAPCSRLGVTVEALAGADLDGITGFHFHTLCEQGFEPLARTVAAVEAEFGGWLGGLDWVNFGGGHLITEPGYGVDGLIGLLREFSARHGVQVYLEPGEAVALNAGVLVTEVMDLVENDMAIAIVDTSATCHMPDVIEAPYRPDILGDTAQGAHRYRLGGPTCLAGDVIGDYGFDQPLRIGQRLMIEDQAHYTMVKTSTFNGMKLPSIALWNSRTDALEIVRTFAYDMFRDRLS